VVTAAAELADEVGLDRLSLAALAARLGVRLPSLYKHIDSLDGLRRDVAVLAVTELGAAMGAAAVGRSGSDALRSVADAYRDYGQRCPGRYAATVRAPAADDAEHTAAAEAVLRTVLAVLTGYGLTGNDAIDATRALRATLHGFVALEAGGGFGMPVDVDRSYSRLVDGFDATLYRWGDTGRRSPTTHLARAPR
jgi:AcrR family transcriptional regulator